MQKGDVFTVLRTPWVLGTMECSCAVGRRAASFESTSWIVYVVWAPRKALPVTHERNYGQSQDEGRPDADVTKAARPVTAVGRWR